MQGMQGKCLTIALSFWPPLAIHWRVNGTVQRSNAIRLALLKSCSGYYRSMSGWVKRRWGTGWAVFLARERIRWYLSERNDLTGTGMSLAGLCVVGIWKKVENLAGLGQLWSPL